MSLMPLDPSHPLFKVMNPGLINPGSIGRPNMGGLGGLFGQVQQGQQQQGGLRGLLSNPDLAMALLANSGYSPHKRGFGEILGTSALQARQMGQQREDDAFKRKYMEAQMQQMQNNQGKSMFGAVSPDKFTRESIAKFEQSGKYSDLEQAPMQRENIDSAQIRNYQFRESLKTPEQKQQFDDIMRQNYDVVESGGVKNVVRRGASPTVQPLISLQDEIAATASKKGAEAEAGAVGTGAGQVRADIQKKGSNSEVVLGLLDEADKLLSSATGSGAGSLLDKGAATVGVSTQGAQSTAGLRVIQAGLMMNMPRMEGPQGEKDVELYQQAAAQIGDDKVPTATRRAAMQVIRNLQNKYAERAEAQKTGGGEVKRKRYNPATGKIE
jgi:hypothetical protein